MNTSGRAPASIWRASVELDANDSLTRIPVVRVQDSDSASTTLVSEDAAYTSSSGGLDSWPCAGAWHPNRSRERISRRVDFIVVASTVSARCIRNDIPKVDSVERWPVGSVPEIQEVARRELDLRLGREGRLAEFHHARRHVALDAQPLEREAPALAVLEAICQRPRM